MTLGKLKTWISETLRDSVEFQNLCTSKVGSTLNFFSSPPNDNVSYETLPLCSVFSGHYENDDRVSESWNQFFTIPMAIVIAVDENFVDNSGIITWESTDIVEELAIKAPDILKSKASNCQISGESVLLLQTDLMISEIGDADDAQASMILTFGKYNSI